jgi:hypothetical protein
MSQSANVLKKIGFVPDTHIPYHHVRNWELALEALGGFKPDILVQQGDLADFYSVSSHRKDPSRQLNLDWELEQVNEGLDQLDGIGAKEKIFIGGNHEDRLTRYLQDKAPELFGMINIPELFKLDERGWEYTPYKENTKLGKLWLTHDIGTSTRYAVFRAADMFQHSNSTAHTHRMVYIVEGNAIGESSVSCSFGWLGDPDQCDYMHKVNAKRNWAQGFGYGYLNQENGEVHLCPVPIVNNSCVVEGVLYKN